MLQLGFRPSVVCCEYNAFLGKGPLTVMYEEDFSRRRLDPQRGLYFGVAVGAWKHLFAQYGYKFCGVDTAGVNVFFCLPERFTPCFLDDVTGPEFAYTNIFVKKFRVPGEELERELLARPDLVFVDVTEENVEDIVADCDLPPADGRKPEFIAGSVQLARMPWKDLLKGAGRWEVLEDIGESVTGWPRNHNASLLKDHRGRLPDPSRLTIALSLAEAHEHLPPDFDWLWTYRIATLQYQPARRGSFLRPNP